MQIRIKELKPLVKSVADSRLKWALIGIGILVLAVLSYGFISKQSAAEEAKAQAYVKPPSLIQAAAPPEHPKEVIDAQRDLAKITVTPDATKPNITSLTVPCMINGASALCVPATANPSIVTAQNQPMQQTIAYQQPPAYIPSPQNYGMQSAAYQPPQAASPKPLNQQEQIQQINAGAQFAPARSASQQPQQPTQPAISPLDQLQSQLGNMIQHPPSAPIYPAQTSAVQDDPNGQHGKAQFDKPASDGEYNAAKRVAPVSRWVVEPGDTISAILVHKVISDLPGDLVGEVSKDVLDSPTHQYVLIPRGSLVVGSYSSMVSYAQGRVQEVWKYLRFPDGSYIVLDKFRGLSSDGSAGLHDQVDNHLKRLVGGVLLSSVFAAAIQIGQNRTNNSTLEYPSTGQLIGSAASQQAGQVGQQITSRNLNVQPTLKIRPGEPFAIEVDKAILFDGPYTAVDWSNR